MSDQNKILSTTWQKSIIVGTIWGVFEITAGTFIHNLALPLIAGTILSFIGVVITVTFQAQWKVKGLFWRASLICAALKSISPSAVLITPMLAISLEGLLMESAVRLFGINIFGLLVAGGLSVLSVLFFKIIRLIMIYGQGIVDTYNSLFAMAKNELGIAEGDSWKLILFLAVIYFLTGVAAAVTGLLTSKRINLDESGVLLNLDNFGKNEQVRSAKSTRNVYYIIFHLVFLIAFLSLQSSLNPIITFSTGFFYLGICFGFYQKVRVITKKIRFWLPILFLSLIIPVISNNATLQESIIQGFKVLIRATLVILSFLAISVELRSKIFTEYFSRSRLQPLYLATSIAFSTLPHYLSRLRNAKIHSDDGKFFSHYIHQLFKGEPEAKTQPIIIITGDKGSGKTSAMKELIKHLDIRDADYAGFYAKPVFKEGHRFAFKLILLPDETELPLCERENGEKYGKFIFEQGTIEDAENLILSTSNDTVIIMDEIGLYELENQAWADILSKTINRNPLIITIRTEFLQRVLAKWHITNPIIVNVKDFDANLIVKALV